MKLKIAILEDNKEFLKDRKQNLVESELVDVVAWATNSGEFISKVKECKPEALLLDIDLGGDSMNGLDIAYKLKLPVLFVSGYNPTRLKEIETLKREFDLVVDHITKPFSERDFIKTVSRFVSEVSAAYKTRYIHLDFGETKRNKVNIDTIVYLCAEKESGSESNNKKIFFTDRKPEILIDFSFSKMEEKGFSKNDFITIHKSFRVNADKIKHYNKITHEIEVEVFFNTGKHEKRQLPVSENFRNGMPGLRR
jgi:CheY-like chemotaxis protein